MKTVYIEGFIYEVKYSWQDAPTYALMSSPNSSDEHYALVGPAKFAYQIPDDFDPIPAQVAGLREQREEIVSEFSTKLAQVDHKLSKLLAITNTVPA